MIFVTVGAQMPFDRLIETVDRWAGLRGRSDVFAQIGTSECRPEHIGYAQFISPEQFGEHMDQAEIIVAHAGMGSIISAIERRKPILVMPRRSALGETRNDHQVATARQFKSMQLVEVAMDEQELADKLDRLDEMRSGKRVLHAAASHCADCPFAEHPEICPDRTTNTACPHLLTAVQSFVTDEDASIEDYAIAPPAHAMA